MDARYSVVQKQAHEAAEFDLLDQFFGQQMLNFVD